MARLYSTGFELNSATSGIEGDTYSSVVIGTTNVRSGTYALRANTGGGFWRTQVLASDSATAVGYIRFYLYIATLPSANTQIFRLATSGNTPEIDINLTTGGQLQLLNGLAVQIGSNSSTLSTNTWYRIEIAHNPGTGSDTAYLNGTSFASGSGTTGLWSRVLLGSITGTPTLDLYFDDVAVNDNSGSFQNSLPGDGKIIYLRPNAAGDNTGFTTGVSDNTNHYVNVSEVTPDDDTSYNQTSTASQTEDYNIQNSGIGASDTVNVVSVGVRYRKVTSGTLVFNVRAKASSGGTVEASSNISSATTTFQTNAEAVPHNYPLTMYDLPGASTTAWTQTDLDAAQIGLATVSNTGSNWRVTKIWMLVDYTPSTATTITPSFINRSPALYAPVVKGLKTITPSFITRTPSVYAPTVRSIKTISPAFITRTSAIYAPTLGKIRTIIPSFVARSATTFLPTLYEQDTVTPPFVNHVPTVYQPTITKKFTITPNEIVRTPVAYQPTITVIAPIQTISPSRASRSAVVYQPIMLPVYGIEPSKITRSVTVYQPVLSVSAVTIIVGFVARNPAAYAPSLQTIRDISPAKITRTPSVYAPTLRPINTITPQIVVRTPVAYQPNTFNLLQIIYPPFVNPKTKGKNIIMLTDGRIAVRLSSNLYLPI